MQLRSLSRSQNEDKYLLLRVFIYDSHTFHTNLSQKRLTHFVRKVFAQWCLSGGKFWVFGPLVSVSSMILNSAHCSPLFCASAVFSLWAKTNFQYFEVGPQWRLLTLFCSACQCRRFQAASSTMSKLPTVPPNNQLKGGEFAASRWRVMGNSSSLKLVVRKTATPPPIAARRRSTTTTRRIITWNNTMYANGFALIVNVFFRSCFS